MSDFIINDHILTKECDSLAADIFAKMLADLAPDETPEDKRDDMDDRAHEDADGHEWVIYNYKALMLCAHCDTSNGEDFLEDCGMPKEPDIYKLACAIAYGEMRARIMAEIDRLIEEWEDTRPDLTAEDEVDA